MIFNSTPLYIKHVLQFTCTQQLLIYPLHTPFYYSNPQVRNKMYMKKIDF